MNRILLATDFSTRSDRALRRAALIADRSGAAITLLHVVDDDQPAYLIERQREAALPLLEDAVRTIQRFDRVAADMQLVTGEIASTIVGVADTIDAGLIVVGPHRRKLKNIFVGTTAERTLSQSRRPVLMANGVPTGAYDRTLIALDFDAASRHAARSADELGLLRGTETTALHAFDAPAAGMMKRAMQAQDSIDHYVAGQEQQASPAFDRLLAELDLRPHRRVLEPAGRSPAHAILACADAVDAEVIIVGSNARSGAERWLRRSVALEVLRVAERDVLVVPAPASSRAEPNP